MRILSFLALAAAVSLTVGCDDNFGPEQLDFRQDTAALFSLDRPEYVGRPAAYDFIRLREVVVESPGETGEWDVALTGEAGELFLTPAGALVQLNSRPAIAVVRDRTFEALARAPADTAFRETEGVLAETGSVYVVRTRRFAVVGGSCVNYAKVQPLEVDEAAGTLRFRTVQNPNCNDRALVPPSED